MSSSAWNLCVTCALHNQEVMTGVDAATWSCDGAMVAVGQGQQLQIIPAPGREGGAVAVLTVSCPDGKLKLPPSLDIFACANK